MLHYILYRIDNLLNGRFYIGKHVTPNLNDGYLGSGKRLKAEIKKYGRANFKRTLLETVSSLEELNALERTVVALYLGDPLCLNLKDGGEGGGKFWSEEHRKKCQVASNASPKRTFEFRSEASKKAIQTQKRNGVIHFSDHATFTGRKHSEKTKKKISASCSIAQAGEKNSQFGSCWVTDGVKPIKIRKEQLDEYLAKGYSRGRNISPLS